MKIGRQRIILAVKPPCQKIKAGFTRNMQAFKRNTSQGIGFRTNSPTARAPVLRSKIT